MNIRAMAVAKPQDIATVGLVLPNSAQTHFMLVNTALSSCSQQ